MTHTAFIQRKVVRHNLVFPGEAEFVWEDLVFVGEAVDENKDELSMEELKYESMRHEIGLERCL